MPQPAREGVEPEEIGIHGGPALRLSDLAAKLAIEDSPVAARAHQYRSGEVALETRLKELLGWNDIHDTANLVRYAIRKGLIQP